MTWREFLRPFSVIRDLRADLRVAVQARAYAETRADRLEIERDEFAREFRALASVIGGTVRMPGATKVGFESDAFAEVAGANDWVSADPDADLDAESVRALMTEPMHGA